MKKIIFIGYKSEAIEYCINNNIQPIVLVDPWDDPEYIPSIKGNELRIFVNDSSNDFFNLTALIYEGIEKVDAVISLYEYTQFNAAFLSEYYHCPSVKIKTAINFRDKRIQKKLASEVYRTAKTYSLYDVFQNSSITYPLVIKPSSGTGSQLTKVVQDEESLIKEYYCIKEKSDRYNDVMIEEFISGEEYYVDGWISKGEVRQFTVSKYANPLRYIYNGKITQGITLPILSYQSIYSKVKDMLIKILLKLGLTDGVFHLEFFKEDESDDLVFSECACRLGGVSPEVCFRENFNLNLYEVLIRIAMGETVISNLPIGAIKYTGMTYLPIPSNKITFLPTINDFHNICGEFVIDVKYNWQIGQPIPNLERSTAEKLGIVTVSGNNIEDVMRKLSFARKKFLQIF